MYDIARTRTSLAILPNIQILVWSTDTPACVMFMHSGIKRFSINLRYLKEEQPNLGAFFDDVAVRMPALTHLSVTSYLPMNALEHEVARVLPSLTKLQSLTLPRFFFTTRIAECVSHLPHLECIQFLPFLGINGREVNIALFQPELSEGAFASLYDISFAAAYKDVERFLTIPFAPANLTKLWIESKKIELPSVIYQLLDSISKNCRMITHLTLISSCSTVDDPDISQRVNMGTLKPILSCTYLKSLKFLHQRPLDLQREDLDAIAQHWPSLETLHLGHEPIDLLSSDLALDALIPFAHHCHNLVELGMFIDASAHRIPSFSLTSAFPSFKKLKTLCVGVSIIPESGPVAMFLNRLLPASCTIDSDLTDLRYESFDLNGIAMNIYHERVEKWEQVNNMVALLVQARAEWCEISKGMQ